MGNSGATEDRIRSDRAKNWSKHFDAAGLARFLRGLHPEKTAQHVAAATKMPADTVKKWLAGESAPNGRALLVLSCTYGPELMAAMLDTRPDWLDAATRLRERDGLQRELAVIEARLGRAPSMPAHVVPA